MLRVLSSSAQSRLFIGGKRGAFTGCKDDAAASERMSHTPPFAFAVRFSRSVL